MKLGDNRMSSPVSSPFLQEQPKALSTNQLCDIALLVLAFSCVIATLTTAVGNGAVVVRSVGGTTEQAPLALALFFLGMSLISLTTTHWIFALYPRRIGFWVGCALGLLGSFLSIVGCIISSPILVLLSNLLLGASCGMGMYLRFAAVEVVPPNFGSQAVSWTLCGGCIAAFLGPETSQLATDRFGSEPNLKFVGVFGVAAIFIILEAIFVAFIKFPWGEDNQETEFIGDLDDINESETCSLSHEEYEPFIESTIVEESNSPNNKKKKGRSRRNVKIVFDEEAQKNLWGDDDEGEDRNENENKPLLLGDGNRIRNKGYGGISLARKSSATKASSKPPRVSFAPNYIESIVIHNVEPIRTTKLKDIVFNTKFLIPLLVGVFTWAIMAMPMSIFRVAMKQLDFTTAQSLRVIEFHFFMMYLPGFWTGSFVKQHGPVKSVLVAISCFMLATITNLCAPNTNITTLTWYGGLILLAIGWNFGFTTATVWITEAYVQAPDLKPKVQAANEFGMFFLSGSAISTSGYLYAAGTTPIEGWRILNTAIVGLIVSITIMIITQAVKLQERQKRESIMVGAARRSSMLFSHVSFMSDLPRSSSIIFSQIASDLERNSSLYRQSVAGGRISTTNGELLLGNRNSSILYEGIPADMDW